MNTNITEMGIIPMLSAVLGGDVAEGSGSTEMRRGRGEVLGVINSQRARRLFTASAIIDDSIRSLDAEHQELHAKDIASTDHDCESFCLNQTRRNKRGEILNNLFWQAVTEEYPETVFRNLIVCDGWTIVSDDQEDTADIHIQDKSALTFNYTNEVASIVKGDLSNIAENTDGQKPISEGEEVIGLIEDVRVRAFWSLVCKVYDEYKGLLASKSGEEVFAMMRSLAITQLIKLAEISNALFWCGVRDTNPNFAEQSNIGIREGWKIVKYTPTHSGLQVLKFTILSR